MAEKNGWLKTTGAILGGILLVITLVTLLLINPVRETAVEAKGRAERNTEDIHELDVKVKGIEKDVENIDKNVERFMRDAGVPPVQDVPAGEYPTDKQEVK